MPKYSIKWTSVHKNGRMNSTGRIINAKNEDDAKKKISKQFKGNIHFNSIKRIG